MTREEYYAAVAEYKDKHLEHHGILGMKWGIRRYQNKDGSLTKLGAQRAKEGLDSYEKTKKTFKENSKNPTGTEFTINGHDFVFGGSKKQFKEIEKEINRRNKAELNKQYYEMKRMHKADQGEKLYLKGERIGGHEETNRRLGRFAGVATALGGLTISLANLDRNMGLGSGGSKVIKNNSQMKQIIAASLILPVAAKGIQEAHKIYSNHKDDKLRSYYMYSNRYNVKKTKGTFYSTKTQKVINKAKNYGINSQREAVEDYIRRYN